MSVLVLYASNHGHTAKVAGRMADAVRAEGHEVDLRDAKNDQAADPEKYDGVIVGASLHGGHHQREVVSHDYDYTDWDAVDRFGRDFAASV
jgi:menaquinone-dependent protoporphyrinogen oxidase